MKNKSVIKHSATVQITNQISLFQRKTFNVLLAHAYHDLPNQERFEISEQALKKILGIKTRDQELLKHTFEALVTCAVKFNYLGKDKKHVWDISALLSRARVTGGICFYEYSSFLREMLYKPEIYARINLRLQSRFKSKHALALYELCVDYYIAKNRCGFTPFIEVVEFCSLMGITGKQAFKVLNRDVIKPAVTEVNAKSDLLVEVEYRRESRRITALKFRIKPNPKSENRVTSSAPPKRQQIPISATAPQIPDTTNPAEKVLLDQVASHGTDPSLARRAIDAHGLDGANEILISALARHQAKPKRDFAAYLAQSFRRGWGLKSDAKRAEKQLKAERMAARAVKFEKAQADKAERERAEQEREEESQAQIQTEWNRLDALVDSLTPDLYEALKTKVIGNNRELKPALLKVRMRKMVEEFLTQDR